MEARINRGSKRYRSKKGVGGLSSMTITLKVFLDWKGRSLRCEYSETWGNVAPQKTAFFHPKNFASFLYLRFLSV